MEYQASVVDTGRFILYGSTFCPQICCRVCVHEIFVYRVLVQNLRPYPDIQSATLAILTSVGIVTVMARNGRT